MKSSLSRIEKLWLTTLLLLSTGLPSLYVEAFCHIHVPRINYADTTTTMLSRKSVDWITLHSSRTNEPADTNRIWSSDDDDTAAMNVNSDAMGTGSTSSSASTTWSVTDNWNQLSQSDNINYNFGGGTGHNDTGDIRVLNSIDQVTLAALRMQNFGMSTPIATSLSEEEIWIRNSIQQIMVVDQVEEEITTAKLNTVEFLDDMGKEIAMLVRCNENDGNNHDNNNSKEQNVLFMDECEILDDNEFTASATTDKQGKSSYQRVELHNGTPIWMKDGEFVFIDEQSCIGCMQCASAAPGSFQMLEQGRARTFCQRNSPDVISAVASCPVDCMHYVSFDELKELETARDVGVADDHRHFGHNSARGYIPPTPLHISRRDSDANHKSSFYHFIQDKCSKSTSCPQRGCYDCPKFAPGKNPYFQEKLSESTHVRAEYFKETGTADAYRKTVDL